MKEYTIIFTQLCYGQIITQKDKSEIRYECEKLKKLSSLQKEDAYIRIEVVNNNTGEIREYWNNQDNEIKF